MRSSIFVMFCLLVAVQWIESSPDPDPLDTININLNIEEEPARKTKKSSRVQEEKGGDYSAFTQHHEVEQEHPEGDQEQEHEYDKSETITGLIFCDNWFEFWFNGKLVAKDPMLMNPHNAVRVSFTWDGVSDKTYAIRCQDYMVPTVYKYIDGPKENISLGIGSFAAKFSDGTHTNSSWSVFTEVSGPSEESIKKGCSKDNPYVCEYKNKTEPLNWFSPSFIEDSSWMSVIEHGPSAKNGINYGALPPKWIEGKGCCYSQNHLNAYLNLTTNDGCSVNPDWNNPAAGVAFHMEKHQCVNPWDHFSNETEPGQPKFIWGKDPKRDYLNLFRFTSKHLE